MPREIRKSKHPSLRPNVHQLTREIAARNRNQTQRTWKRRVSRTFHISGVQKRENESWAVFTRTTFKIRFCHLSHTLNTVHYSCNYYGRRRERE